MSENDIKIVKRGRGSVLLHGGHQYYKQTKYKNGRSVWKCKMYKLLKCAGSVTLSAVSTYLPIN